MLNVIRKQLYELGYREENGTDFPLYSINYANKLGKIAAKNKKINYRFSVVFRLYTDRLSREQIKQIDFEAQVQLEENLLWQTTISGFTIDKNFLTYLVKLENNILKILPAMCSLKGDSNGTA